MNDGIWIILGIIAGTIISFVVLYYVIRGAVQSALRAHDEAREGRQRPSWAQDKEERRWVQ